MKKKNPEATGDLEQLTKEVNTYSNEYETKDEFANKNKTTDVEHLGPVNDQIETGILINDVVSKYEDIKMEKKPTLSADEMDKALSDVKLTKSKVGFFKRGKRQENFEKRRDYEKEYKGLYDDMTTTAEARMGEIKGEYFAKKGSQTLASDYRKTPFIAVRMEQLKELGEYDGEFDAQAFLKAMDTPVGDAKLTEEDKTEEGQKALLARRNEKAKAIEKVGDVIRSWDMGSFDISSPDAFLRDKAKFRRDLAKFQLCEEFDAALEKEYLPLKEKGCDCKYNDDELLELQAMLQTYMSLSGIYTAYLKIAESPYFAKVLDSEFDKYGLQDFREKFYAKRKMDLHEEYKDKMSESEVDHTIVANDLVFKYFTAITEIKSITFGDQALNLGGDIKAYFEKQKAKIRAQRGL